MKLFSYILARDFGFAPNPFYSICSLATCKPIIRKKAQIGDWIIGYLYIKVPKATSDLKVA